MAIAFRCGCGRLLRIGDQHVGKLAKCPACQQVVRVPASPARPQASDALPEPSIRSPGPATRPDVPASLTTGEARTTVPCPACQMLMSARAALCPSCGLNLRTGKMPTRRRGVVAAPARPIDRESPAAPGDTGPEPLRLMDEARQPSAATHGPGRLAGDSEEPGVRVVFRASEDMSWPRLCVGCLAGSPVDEIVWEVAKSTQSPAEPLGNGSKVAGRIVGGIVGGLLGALTGDVAHGIIGGALAGGGKSEGQGATQEPVSVLHRVPFCAGCRGRIGRATPDRLEGAGSLQFGSSAVLALEIERDCVVLTFRTGDYAECFREANEGRVFDSVDACLSGPAAAETPAEDDGRRARLARLAALPSGGLAPLSQEEAIYLLLKSYLPQGGLFVDPEIPPKKSANARVAACVPEGERVLALIDCSFFGSAKSCLVFGRDALYYYLTEMCPPVPASIPYKEFPYRKFRVAAWYKTGVIEMDRNQNLDISGSRVPRARVVDMLECIKVLRIQRAARPSLKDSGDHGA